MSQEETNRIYFGWDDEIIVDDIMDQYFYPEETVNGIRFSHSFSNEELCSWDDTHKKTTTYWQSYFTDPFNPTESELQMFELSFGIDLSVPIKRLKEFNKEQENK